MKKRLKFFSALLALLLVAVLSTASIVGSEVLADQNNYFEGALTSETESIARYFIEYCLAKNGNLLDCDFYAKEAGDFNSFVKVRNDAILNRRAAFGLDVVDFSIELNKTAEVRYDNTIVYYFKSEERTTFSSSHETSSVARFYLVELTKEDGEWKVLNALSSDEYFYRLFPITEIIEQETNLLRGNYNTDDIRRRYSNIDFSQMEGQYQEALQQSLLELKFSEEMPVDEDSMQVRGSFNRSAMKRYQNNWAKSRNPNWGDFTPADCQNFASQVIYAGGAPMCNSWYYYSTTNRSLSWINVMSMRTFVTSNSGKGPRGTYYSSASSLLCGDLVMFDWNGDGVYNHTMVIYNTGSNPTVSGHTTDTLNEPLSNYAASNIIYIHLVDYGN